jgi:geranylgeranyl diphosphate/geranylgeranyl-bacteriochlorophyllide a reductase
MTVRTPTFDVVVVGGGPAGATAATDLAARGFSVVLLDRGGRTKPCGGAIPPRVLYEFDVPEHLLVARVTAARVVSPSSRAVDMPIENGFVGMVDRGEYDEWLRQRARHAGADVRRVRFERLSRDADGTAVAFYHDEARNEAGGVRGRAIVGADGALSRVAQQGIRTERVPHVAAFHEIVESPLIGFNPSRCDVYYQGCVSPDFYGWVFPHGATTSVGAGSAVKGFSLRQAVTRLREFAGLSGASVARREGAPIPLRPRKRWDNGCDVVLAGDAAGVVAPASGEGIYYAMLGGRLAADAVEELLATRDSRCLGLARRRFMRAHGRVFQALGMMQRYWYRSDARRERFVSICNDPDVQYLTWQSYLNKQLVRAKPATHARIVLKNLGHLTGLMPA